MERAPTEPRLVCRCVISASVFASLLYIDSTDWAKAYYLELIYVCCSPVLGNIAE